MAKHEMKTQINETLELHYQNEIKRLKGKVSELESVLNEARLKIEDLHTVIKMKNDQIEVLLEKLVER